MDYRGSPKDYSERWNVVVTNHDGGWTSYDIVSVGRAYSLALWAISPKGEIYKRISSANADDSAGVGLRIVEEAEEQVNRLAAKRRDGARLPID